MSFFLVLREVLEQSMSLQEVSLHDSLEIWSVLKELSQSVRTQLLLSLEANNLTLFKILGSLVRPKIVRSVHYCPATKKTIERRYTDLTSFDAFPSSAVYPTKVITLFFPRDRKKESKDFQVQFSCI